MSKETKPPYKVPIILCAIIVGLMVTSLNLIIILHIVAGQSPAPDAIIGVIVIIGLGITCPIILIVLNIVAIYIHEKVIDKFEYFPILVGVIVSLIGMFIALVAIISGISAFIDGLTPLHLPYYGFYAANGTLGIITGVLGILLLVYGIKICKS